MFYRISQYAIIRIISLTIKFIQNYIGYCDIQYWNFYCNSSGEYFLCGTVELSRRRVARDLVFVLLCCYGFCRPVTQRCQLKGTMRRVMSEIRMPQIRRAGLADPI